MFEDISDVIMGAMASQISSLTFVYSTVYLGEDQRKHQSSASLALVWGIHRWPVNSPHKWPVTRKMFLFDDVIMERYRDNQTCPATSARKVTVTMRNSRGRNHLVEYVGGKLVREDFKRYFFIYINIYHTRDYLSVLYKSHIISKRLFLWKVLHETKENSLPYELRCLFDTT